ncbi:glycosyltransferase family 4 protein [Salinivibrio costicola]|uniref:glycosyltransferase family 4 protein n=1 Tax=Salinivibrio costicola TaxID=51367 RepID=UPI00039587E0|nr:glycosyltransferase family 4 protein [Salinivibrio costicola]
MKVALWVNELISDSGGVIIGGVQTYTFELALGLKESGYDVYIFQKGTLEPLVIDDFPIESLSDSDWLSGEFDSNFDINIDLNPNDAPRLTSCRTIGVQHGVYWDRPPAGKFWRRLGAVGNAIRMVKGSSILDKYSKIVCVDLAFPLQASCIRRSLNWNKIVYIPNFAPKSSELPQFTNEITKIVFARRFVEHRGTKLFTEAVIKILDTGWNGEVHFIGSGPDEAWVRSKTANYPNVKIYSLPYSDRLEAFDDKSLVVVPTISTEGTSLSCLEAWSKGSLVVSTGVGGLANIVIDNVNAVMIRPLVSDLFEALNRELHSDSNKISELRRRGFDIQQTGFTRSLWLKKWIDLIKTVELEE